MTRSFQKFPFTSMEAYLRVAQITFRIYREYTHRADKNYHFVRKRRVTINKRINEMEDKLSFNVLIIYKIKLLFLDGLNGSQIFKSKRSEEGEKKKREKKEAK